MKEARGVEPDLIEMLTADNERLRTAGGHLAEAAMRVVTTSDGIHRLSLAVSYWCFAVAAEGGRADRAVRAMTRDTWDVDEPWRATIIKREAECGSMRRQHELHRLLCLALDYVAENDPELYEHAMEYAAGAEQ